MISSISLCLFFTLIKKGFGKILNLASTAAFQPLPNDAIYGATKSYILSLSEAISCDLKKKGVVVSCLCPGVTVTPFYDKADMNNIRLRGTTIPMTAEKVAKIAYKGLRSGKKVIIPGLFNKLLIESVRFTPRSIVLMISRFILSKK